MMQMVKVHSLGQSSRRSTFIFEDAWIPSTVFFAATPSAADILLLQFVDTIERHSMGVVGDEVVVVINKQVQFFLRFLLQIVWIIQRK